MRFATRRCWQGSSSNGSELISEWWVAPCTNWKDNSPHELDQRCFEAGETGAATSRAPGGAHAGVPARGAEATRPHRRWGYAVSSARDHRIFGYPVAVSRLALGPQAPLPSTCGREA